MMDDGEEGSEKKQSVVLRFLIMLLFLFLFFGQLAEIN